MFSEIKNKVEYELKNYLRDLDRQYSLKSISPIIFNNIKNFALRKGKRVRPILFIISYLGFSGRSARGLYRSAVSLEFLHDFMLVHDDIIDKSDTRRGLPSMHVLLQKYIRGKKNVKFDGRDLAIVLGDVMYAFSIHSFLSVQENMQRKEMALKKLIEAAIYTGSGEFLELLFGLEDFKTITLKDIYKIYDYKTATYTFASPLAVGAILAGARKDQIDKLFNYGIYLGRAFQIKDDIIGMFTKESEIGKSNLTDIREAKKTILIWHAYHKSSKAGKQRIKDIFSKNNINQKDLYAVRAIIKESGTLDYAEAEINKFLYLAWAISNSLDIRPRYKKILQSYSQEILKL